MNPQLIAQLILVLMVFIIFAGLYIGTKRPWYIRFDRGEEGGFYSHDAHIIMAHTQEGAKRKAKRMVRRNDWVGFKLRTY